MNPVFHLSIPVDDLDRAKSFYLNTLGCEIGRETKGRFDINFFSHHVVAHLSPKDGGKDDGTLPSDGATSPLRHFGVVLRCSAALWGRSAAHCNDLGPFCGLLPPCGAHSLENELSL